MKRLSPFWRFNLIGWTIFILPQFLNALAAHREFDRALGFALFLWPSQIFFSGLLHPIYRRMAGSAGKFTVLTAAWMIGLSFTAALCQTELVQQFVAFMDWYNPTWTHIEEWLLRMIFYWLIYMAWGLLYFWLKAENAVRNEGQRADEARAEAGRMELYFLRSQLDPHFLFNALNGIAAQIIPQPQAALKMVRELAGYLRYSLDHRHDAVTPLSLELDALAGYLEIERARFGERLETDIEASPEARERMVPSFLLQPLVENAGKHSLQHSQPPWKLGIKAALECDGALGIVVYNSGTLAENWREVEGVGLQLLRRRLELHYPQRHRFSLVEKDGNVRAELRMEGEPCFA